MQKKLPKKFFFLLVTIIFFINMITAYFSGGYYQADEHFQILEFMNYKLGHNPISNMPWEFFSKMRPWILPGFYFISYKIIHIFFGSINPFNMARIFRMESSLIATFAEIIFIFSYYKSIVEPFFAQENYSQNILKWKVISSVIVLFWLMPYLSARTSAENFSNAIVLIIYSCLIFSIKNSIIFNSISQNLSFKSFYVLLLGILFGIAFQIRYQMTFFMVGFYFWCIFNTREKLKFTLLLLVGFILITGIALFIDRWGYGEFTLAPWNYFIANIINGTANNFGVAPWYTYIPLINELINYEFGPLLFIFYFIAVYKYKKNLFIWCSFTFFIAHSLIPHKESRFLFPILTSMMIPACEVFIDCFFNQIFRKIFTHPTTKIVINILILLNFLELSKNLFRWSAKNNYALEYLQENMRNNTYYSFHGDMQCDCNDESIRNYCGLKLNFYSISDKNFVHLNSIEDFKNILKDSKTPQYLYISKNDGIFINSSFFTEKCQIEYNSSIIPNFIFNRKFVWRSLLLKHSDFNLFLKCMDRS